MSSESTTNIADQTLAGVIEAVASASIAPGAGAAGAIVLALAAACGRKAIAVTLRHRSEDAVLSKAAEQLAYISGRALAGAQEDGERFKEFVQDKEAGASQRLINAEQSLLSLAELLAATLREIEAHIDPVMAGDIVAAHALHKAFVVVGRTNLEESRESAAERLAT